MGNTHDKAGRALPNNRTVHSARHLRTMKIPLDRLEEVIDARIVQRGLKYYEDGAVDEPVHRSTSPMMGSREPRRSVV